eukprot:8908153-Lingulodinium_polyedra.AAC.1
MDAFKSDRTGVEYKRLRVACNLHAGCLKYRSIGHRQTARRGKLEPVAYLGAWLSAARKFRTAKQHVAFKPSNQDIDDFLA